MDDENAEIAKVSVGRRIALSKEVCDYLNIKAGDYLWLVVKDGAIRVTKVIIPEIAPSKPADTGAQEIG